MNYGRLVLAVVTMTTMVLGDCSVGYARGRIFGRRCTNYVPTVSRTQRIAPASSKGASLDSNIICPVQQTPYYAGTTNGVDYYMFYAQPYPQCSGMPQPVYLPAGSPVGCTGTDPPCFDPTKENSGPNSPNLADMGHRMTEGQLKGFGQPVGRYQIDFGTDGNHDVRNIDFYQLDIPKPRHPYEMWIGIENHRVTANYGPPLTPYKNGPWNSHAQGKTVRMNGSNRPYYVLLHDPTDTN